MSPSVSIIIPVYNYERYVAEAIESALGQTYPGCEVLVVDDGSTDGSAEIARGYGERVRLISKRNAGLSAARNTGIEEASGDFLVFLDADDRLLPGMVEQCLEQFRQLPEEFGLVAVAVVKITDAGEEVANQNYGPRESLEVTARELLVQNRFVPLVMVRREVFEECGMFDPGLKSSEDRDMWIRVATRYRLWVHGRVCAEKRAHASNMSNNARRQSANIEQVLRKAERSYAWVSGDECLKRRAWSYYYFQSALIFAGVPDEREAAWRMLKSLCLWPLSFTAEGIRQVPYFRLRPLVKYGLIMGRQVLLRGGVGMSKGGEA